MDPVVESPWWSVKREEAHERVREVARRLRDASASVRSRALVALQEFEGRSVSGLSPYGYLEAKPYSDLRWSIPRSLCLTVQAKVAGRQRPMPKFVTSGADWQIKRKAKKLNKFVVGQLSERQGQYADAWDLMLDVFLDAAVWSLGAAYIYADPDEQKICIERILAPMEILVDHLEAQHGDPQTILRVRPYDIEKLIARFPKFEKAIQNARSVDQEKTWQFVSAQSSSRTIARQTLVYEAWRLPLSPDKPGRHAICIDGATLVWEDFERREFPIVFFRWVKERLGFHATSLIEESEPISREVNYTLEKMRDAERLNNVFIIADEDALVDEEEIKSNESFVVVRKKPGSEVEVRTPSAYSESTLNWLKMNREMAYQIPGIPEMAATGEKPSGITAAIALRTLADMGSERFAVIDRQNQNAFISLSRNIIWCARELAADNPDFAARWPGKRFLQPIPWEKVDIPDDQYTVQIETIASVAQGVAGRYSTFRDLYQDGLITQQAYLQGIDMGDVEEATERAQAQYNMLEELVDRYLDLTEEELEENPLLYELPEPFLALEEAIVQIGQHYLIAKMDKAPEFNLNLIRTYIQQCDDLLQRRMEKMAQMRAAMGGGGMPANQSQMQGAPTLQ